MTFISLYYIITIIATSMFCAFKSVHNFYYTHFMSNKKYTNSHNYTNPVHLVFTGVASINTFITLNYAGLKDDIMTILAGVMVRVNTNTFKNDFSTIASKDDSLTALIHLGYLGYDSVKKKAFIPNYEVATAFEAALQTGEWTESSFHTFYPHQPPDAHHLQIETALHIQEIPS